MIDDILEALSDGEWHSFFDIAARVREYKNKRLNVTLKFLREFEFIEKQTGVPYYRLVPSVQQFLQEVKRIQRVTLP